MAIQNSNLPPSFVNEVVKIVEHETIVRSNLKSISGVHSWIEEHRTRNGIFDLLDHLKQGSCAVDFLLLLLLGGYKLNSGLHCSAMSTDKITSGLLIALAYLDGYKNSGLSLLLLLVDHKLDSGLLSYNSCLGGSTN
ncbi:hypothetical protein AVEN_271708-1 [Araneus ventricosus]|uniref:Uncharacterized protein n=1 Tax=Araneus ventricosus TaxID=182803 RepID=A0A4Y2J1W9_ARAVE|nr:hypothetical protein AVEN_271708-1 [Araneus ventricosus]